MLVIKYYSGNIVSLDPYVPGECLLGYLVLSPSLVNPIHHIFPCFILMYISASPTGKPDRFSKPARGLQQPLMEREGTYDSYPLCSKINFLW